MSQPSRIILVFIMVILGLNACGRKQDTGINVNGTSITLTAGGHTIVGTLSEPITAGFLFKDEGRAEGTFSGDAFVTTMDITVADTLHAEYGDIFSCGAPGVQPAINAMRAYIFVGADPSVKAAMNNAMELVRSRKIPSLEMTYSVVSVVKQEWNGMTVNDNTGIQILYVTACTVKKNDYFN